MHRTLNPGVVIYGKVSSCCSACAPNEVSQAEVEASVSVQRGTVHCAIDVATIRRGRSTPSPCNQYPETHQHWFLVRQDHLRKADG